jgi:MFS transporter, SP family, sugar:H+ symporter
MLPIFVWLPETACEPAYGHVIITREANSTNHLVLSAYFAACEQDDKGRATLRRINGHVEGYDVEAEYAIVKNTILEERSITASMGQEGGSFKDIMTSYIECLKGTNLVRMMQG